MTNTTEKPKRVVLLIDDSDEDRATFSRYLRRDETFDYEMLEAASGIEALRALDGREVDCVLLDIRLPDMDGLDLLSSISERDGGAAAAVVMLTGTGTEASAVRSMRLGAQDYLVKTDVTVGALQHAVDQAIERFRLQRDLRESEERARLVLNNLPMMVFALDSEGLFTFADGSGMVSMQLRREEVIGQSAYEVFAAEPKVVEQIQRTLAGEQTTWTMSTRGRSFEAYCTVRRDPAGKPDGIYGVVLDVTQRRQAEEALQRSKRRVEAILSGITDAYICLDRDWRILDMNTQAEQTLFHRPKHELIGELAWTEYPDVATSVWYTRYEKAMREGVDAHFEAKSALSGRWYDAHAYPDEDGLTIYLTDITERKRAETDLSLLYQREHRIAETLQRSLLSPAAEGAYQTLDVKTVYKSAKEEAQVGGDFYDIFKLRDNKVAVVVGDVSGKGLDAASRTAEVKYTLRAYLREYPGAAVAMRRLNHYLNQAAETDRVYQESFVCVSLAVIDMATGEIDTVMAGSEPPVIIRADGPIEPLRREGLPLACDAEADYITVGSTLDPGDLLLITTDGLTEARDGRQFLGLEGVAALARAHRDHADLEELGQLILHEAVDFAGGALDDDACILLVRRKDPVHAALVP